LCRCDVEDRRVDCQRAIIALHEGYFARIPIRRLDIAHE
jgi:hypothetical protein